MQRDAACKADCVSSNLADLPAQLARRKLGARMSPCWSFTGAEVDSNPQFTLQTPSLGTVT